MQTKVARSVPSKTADAAQVIDLNDRPVSERLIVPTTAEAAPVFLAEAFDNPPPRTTPTVTPVQDGSALFYRGKSNSLSGEAGRGKTLLAQHALLAEAREGARVLFIDYEKDLSAFVERMVALGATKADAANIAYWRPTESLEQLMPRLLSFCARHGVTLVVIDSVSRALSRVGPGMNENDNNHVRTWYDTSVEPLLRAKVTVLGIDHLAKADNPGSRYARGAGAKLDVQTGTALTMRDDQPFSRSQSGRAVLTVSKDNNGGRAEGSTLTVHVAVDVQAERVALTITEGGAAPAERRPEKLMREISDALAEAGHALSRSKLRVKLGSVKDAELAEAVELLIADGFAAEHAGERNAKMTTLLKPYPPAA